MTNETTQITPVHPFTEYLEALIEGSTVQYSKTYEELYFNVETNPEAMYSLISGVETNFKFRVKPDEPYLINGTPAYKPLTLDQLVSGKMYFVESTASKDLSAAGWFYDYNKDMYEIFTTRGLVHDSQEKAIFNANLRLSYSPQPEPPVEPLKGYVVYSTEDTPEFWFDTAEEAVDAMRNGGYLEVQYEIIPDGLPEGVL